jgi:hypothetical protein
VLGQAEQEEGLQETREVLENVLSEVMAFLELSGTVQQEHVEKRLQSVTVPPDTTSNLQEKRLQGEAVPPPTTVRLLWGTVLPSTTATPTEIVSSKYSKHESRKVPTSQTLIVKKLLKKKCQERKTRKK